MQKKLKHFPSQEPNTHKHVEASKAYTRKISSESQEGDIQWKAWMEENRKFLNENKTSEHIGA